MSDCGEPCDACGNRGTHHLCDTCCEEEAKALEAKLSEVQAVLTEDVRLDQWEKCGIIDSAFIANLRQARRERDEAITRYGITVERWGATERERDEARACLAFERVTVAELRAEVERLRGLLLEVRAATWRGDLYERIAAALDAGPVASVKTALNHPANCSIYDDGRCACGKTAPLVTEGDK